METIKNMTIENDENIFAPFIKSNEIEINNNNKLKVMLKDSNIESFNINSYKELINKCNYKDLIQHI